MIVLESGSGLISIKFTIQMGILPRYHSKEQCSLDIICLELIFIKTG